MMRARGGYCLHAAGAEGIWQFPAGFFDGIIMSSYLEHEVEMRKVLEGAHRALKRGGRIFVRVPNFGSLNRRVMGAKWCGFRYPDHVSYFTLASLRRVAAGAGFRTELMNRMTLWVDDNIQALLVKP
jgi:predicted SAM-dependent methyltransferase